MWLRVSSSSRDLRNLGQKTRKIITRCNELQRKKSRQLFVATKKFENLRSLPNFLREVCTPTTDLFFGAGDSKRFHVYHATYNLGQRPRCPHATSRARKAASHPRIWHAAESQCLCIHSRNGEPQATLLRRLRQPAVPSLSPCDLDSRSVPWWDIPSSSRLSAAMCALHRQSTISEPPFTC